MESLLTSLSFSLFLFRISDLISVGRDSKRHDKEEQVLRGELVRRQERLGHVGGDTVVEEQDFQMASDPEHATAVAGDEAVGQTGQTLDLRLFHQAHLREQQTMVN